MLFSALFSFKTLYLIRVAIRIRIRIHEFGWVRIQIFNFTTMKYSMTIIDSH